MATLASIFLFFILNPSSMNQGCLKPISHGKAVGDPGPIESCKGALSIQNILFFAKDGRYLFLIKIHYRPGLFNQLKLSAKFLRIPKVPWHSAYPSNERGNQNPYSDYSDYPYMWFA
jgi:hypothetical protein